MTLAARQIALLDAMGIPVWHMRADHDVIASEAPVSLTEQERDKCNMLSQSADYVFCHHEDEASDGQRLLQAIVFAMGWTWQLENKLTLAQMQYLLDRTTPINPVCLLFDDSKALAERMATNMTATVIRLPSLTSLLAQPALKKQAWMQLQQVKAMTHGNL